jgi:hypothetical protein
VFLLAFTCASYNKVHDTQQDENREMNDFHSDLHLEDLLSGPDYGLGEVSYSQGFMSESCVVSDLPNLL